MVTIEQFHAAVTAVWEKGKDNHPADPGGATNNGVATHFITDFASRPEGLEFLRSIGIEANFIIAYANGQATEKTRIFDPAVLMSFTPRQCDLILMQAFWVWNGLEEWPVRLTACAAYDFCVNSGAVRGKRYMQRAMNHYETTGVQPLSEDGNIGPRSLARMRDFASPEWDLKLGLKLCDLRLGFLRGLSTFSTFGSGWTNRVNALATFLKGNANV